MKKPQAGSLTQGVAAGVSGRPPDSELDFI